MKYFCRYVFYHLLAWERDKKYRSVFDLFKTAQNETDKKIMIVFDEFQRILSYDIESALDVFRERIMQQDIMYLISGSSISMMSKIVSSSESPLYGHFELLFVKGFTYNVARTFVQKKLKGFNINETQMAFLLDLTHANPFYLDALTFRIREVFP